MKLPSARDHPRTNNARFAESVWSGACAEVTARTTNRVPRKNQSRARAFGHEILGVGGQGQEDQTGYEELLFSTVGFLMRSRTSRRRLKPRSVDPLWDALSLHTPQTVFEAWRAFPSVRQATDGKMMHELHVVRFRDEVEFNIECARWNSVAGVTFGMIFTAARRTVLKCMFATLTPSRLKIDENLNRIPPFTSYCCRPSEAAGVPETFHKEEWKRSPAPNRQTRAPKTLNSDSRKQAAAPKTPLNAFRFCFALRMGVTFLAQ